MEAKTKSGSFLTKSCGRALVASKGMVAGGIVDAKYVITPQLVHYGMHLWTDMSSLTNIELWFNLPF